MHLNTKKQTLGLLALVIITIAGHTLTASKSPSYCTTVSIHYNATWWRGSYYRADLRSQYITRLVNKEKEVDHTSIKNRRVYNTNIYYQSNCARRWDQLILGLNSVTCHQKPIRPFVGVILHMPKITTIQKTDDLISFEEYITYVLNCIGVPPLSSITNKEKKGNPFIIKLPLRYNNMTDYITKVIANNNFKDSVNKTTLNRLKEAGNRIDAHQEKLLNKHEWTYSPTLGSHLGKILDRVIANRHYNDLFYFSVGMAVSFLLFLLTHKMIPSAYLPRSFRPKSTQ